MSKQIILLGPACAGKSLLARAIAEETKLPLIVCDLMQWYYYTKNRIDLPLYTRLKSQSDFLPFLKYIEKLKVIFLENLFKEFHNGVFDFGLLHSFFLDDQNKNKIRSIIEPMNSYLLLPNESLKVSIETLKQRLDNRSFFNTEVPTLKNINTFYLSQLEHFNIAKSTIYTDNLSDNQLLNLITTTVFKKTSHKRSCTSK